MNTQKIKNIYQSRIDAELKELSKMIDLVVESQDLLNQLESKSISELEFKLNEKSGFVSARVSAEAYGLENEYFRLLELEKQIDGKLSANDLTANKTLKKPFIDAVIEKHTEYFSKQEINTKKTLDKIISMFNSLDVSDRKHIGTSRDGKLIYSPFSDLR